MRLTALEMLKEKKLSPRDVQSRLRLSTAALYSNERIVYHISVQLQNKHLIQNREKTCTHSEDIKKKDKYHLCHGQKYIMLG